MDVDFNGDVGCLDAELLQLSEVSSSAIKSNPFLAEKLFEQWLSLPDTLLMVIFSISIVYIIFPSPSIYSYLFICSSFFFFWSSLYMLWFVFSCLNFVSFPGRLCLIVGLYYQDYLRNFYNRFIPHTCFFMVFGTDCMFPLFYFLEIMILDLL